ARGRRREQRRRAVPRARGALRPMTRTVCSWNATGPDGAPAVLAVHSLGTDRTMWTPLVEQLGSEYRVLRVELPGHGDSPAPGGPCSLDDIERAVLAAVGEAGVTCFHYCGVSLGGMLGLRLAARHPERVLSLVAANTAARIGSAELWRDRV